MGDEYAYLRSFLQDSANSASIISKTEVLGYQKLKEDDKNFFESVFKTIQLLPVDLVIIDKSIELRQEKKLWGGSKILITARNSKAQQQNNKLKAIEYGLNEILADLQRRSKKITTRRIKEIFLGEDEKKDVQFDLLENLIQAYMSAKEKEVGIFITKATINTYGRYQKNVKKWIDSYQK